MHDGEELLRDGCDDGEQEVTRIEIMTRLGLKVSTTWRLCQLSLGNDMAQVWGPVLQWGGYCRSPSHVAFWQLFNQKKTLLNYLSNLLGHYSSRLGVSKLTIMHKQVGIRGKKKPLEIGNQGYWLNKQIDTRAGFFFKKNQKPNYTLTSGSLKKSISQ